MAWRIAWCSAALAVIGIGCGRTEFTFAIAQTEVGTAGDPTTGGGTIGGGTIGDGTIGDGTSPVTTLSTLDSGPGDTAPGTFTTLDSGPEDTGPITITATTFDDGPFTTGPLTTTSTDTGPDTVTLTATDPTLSTTDPTLSTTDMSTTDPATSTTDMSTTDPATSTTGMPTTDPTASTTDMSTSSSGTSSSGGDPTCQDAVDCVIACGGASPFCINLCDDGLSPADEGAFDALQFCIILGCFLNGSCAPGSFGSPSCVACRLDGQLDPAALGCADEAAACT